MNRKKLILVAVACLGLTALVCSRIASRLKGRINEDRINLVKEGMTRQEVESILGKATGAHYSSGVTYTRQQAPYYQPWRHGNDPFIWGSYEAQTRIHFDDDGKVEGVFTDYRFEVKVGIWDRIRGWLGL